MMKNMMQDTLNPAKGGGEDANKFFLKKYVSKNIRCNILVIE